MKKHQSEACASLCPVHTALGVIGGKWKLVILWNLQSGTKRYSELKRMIGDVTPKMLSQQLKELEKDGIVERKVYPVVPPKVEYRLTAYGKKLEPVIGELAKFGTGHMARA